MSLETVNPMSVETSRTSMEGVAEGDADAIPFEAPVEMEESEVPSGPKKGDKKKSDKKSEKMSGDELAEARREQARKNHVVRKEIDDAVMSFHKGFETVKARLEEVHHRPEGSEALSDDDIRRDHAAEIAEINKQGMEELLAHCGYSTMEEGFASEKKEWYVSYFFLQKKMDAAQELLTYMESLRDLRKGAIRAGQEPTGKIRILRNELDTKERAVKRQLWLIWKDHAQLGNDPESKALAKDEFVPFYKKKKAAAKPAAGPRKKKELTPAGSLKMTIAKGFSKAKMRAIDKVVDEVLKLEASNKMKALQGALLSLEHFDKDEMRKELEREIEALKEKEKKKEETGEGDEEGEDDEEDEAAADDTEDEDDPHQLATESPMATGA